MDIFNSKANLWASQPCGCLRSPRVPPPQVCLPEASVAQRRRWHRTRSLGAQIYLFPRMFFVFLILLGAVLFSFSCQRNSRIYRGCSHRLVHSLWSHTIYAKRTLAPKSPKPPQATEVRSLGGGCCAVFPGDFVEAHRWGMPLAGTQGQLMNRLISRLDGP